MRLEEAIERFKDRLSEPLWCAATDERFHILFRERIVVDPENEENILGTGLDRAKRYLYWEGQWASERRPHLKRTYNMRFEDRDERRSFQDRLRKFQ